MHQQQEQPFQPHEQQQRNLNTYEIILLFSFLIGFVGLVLYFLFFIKYLNGDDIIKELSRLKQFQDHLQGIASECEHKKFSDSFTNLLHETEITFLYHKDNTLDAYEHFYEVLKIFKNNINDQNDIICIIKGNYTPVIWDLMRYKEYFLDIINGVKSTLISTMVIGYLFLCACLLRDVAQGFVPMQLNNRQITLWELYIFLVCLAIMIACSYAAAIVSYDVVTWALNITRVTIVLQLQAMRQAK